MTKGKNDLGDAGEIDVIRARFAIRRGDGAARGIGAALPIDGGWTAH